MEISRTLLPSTIERLQGGEITPSDENSLIGLLRVGHPHGPLQTSKEAREQISQYTQSPRAALFIARLAYGGYMDELEAVGFVAARHTQEDQGVSIDHLIVTKLARRRNLGRILVENVIDFAEQQRARYVAYKPDHPTSRDETLLLNQLDFMPNAEQIPILHLATKD